MLDAKLLILATSFVVLSVFVTIPQPGSGAHGSQHYNSYNTQRSTEPEPAGDARPHPTCFDEQGHCSNESSQNLAVHNINRISNQIQMELQASHTYLAMAAYFGRDDVAYRGFAKFFMKASDEEREHGVKLVNYLNLRGGYPKIKSVDAPARSEWSSPVKAMEMLSTLSAWSTMLFLISTGTPSTRMMPICKTFWRQSSSANRLTPFVSCLDSSPFSAVSKITLLVFTSLMRSSSMALDKCFLNM